MALATWWRGDERPQLTPIPDFYVTTTCDVHTLARINRISEAEVSTRLLAGHRPYVAYIGACPAGYGWVATHEASIGELKLEFALPESDRYLWDFATLPEWQGKGLYPRLLQAIIEQEPAERFWIIYAPENLPSGAGMQKAGFEPVGQLSFTHQGSVGMVSLNIPDRAMKGAAVLGVSLIDDDLSPCWSCVEKLVCSCHLNPETCSCAIEIRKPLDKLM